MHGLPISDEETKPTVQGVLTRTPPVGDLVPLTPKELEVDEVEEAKFKRIAPIFNEEAKVKILGALASGSDWTRAANLVGGTMRGLFSLMNRDPEFKEKAYEARALADDEVVHNLFNDATKGNTIAQIFWLKNRRSKEWKDKHEIEVRGAELVSAPIEFNLLEAPKAVPE